MKLLSIFEYILVMIKAIAEAWVDVFKRCTNNQINPEIMDIQTEINSLYGQVLLACSITITPGTLTIDLDHDSKTLKVASISPRKKDEIIPFEKYIKNIFD
ncbi:monovalent cation/H+ antiporter subunit E [Methanococcus voltae]|uniref:Energy-converting hydrogenase B subunit A n=2 Tax=Methanococcus voltae TaxID=2188 RepID=A0A8J7UTI4_METVO|nr:monovalent cation/H+ antiporter subunit E [Methanococcus voltae]MBP2172877.1 energy-converting hydrogenase B subunit A [Methanococcus voltae]MBP2201713.1 energy-converting hydrogenase B subunit A [Methanococcus voltae]MCS3922501.1 energy-converting hydrogenase B subunit A [Methanococcus voltae PS]